MSEFLGSDSPFGSRCESSLFGSGSREVLKVLKINSTSFAFVDDGENENRISLSLLRRNSSLILNCERVVLDGLRLRSEVFSED